MAQGRQRVQFESSVSQPTRLPRLTGRLSPQQSFRRVGPAISEVLHASVHPRPRNNESTKSKPKKQRFRPDSGADAILCLDERAGTDSCINVFEPGSHTMKQGVVDPRGMSVPSTRMALPIASSPKGRQTPSRLGVVAEGKITAALAPERKGQAPGESAVEQPGVVRRDAIRLQLPGLLVNRQPNVLRKRRVSKALPSLPPPTPSPCKVSFGPPSKSSPDVFQNNREKILRGHGSSGALVATAPPMQSIPDNSDNSSGSSYDSAEQTWNMINNMMHAVGEDEVKRARESVIQPRVRHNTQGSRAPPSAYVTFPRMRHAGKDRNRSSLGDYSSPEQMSRCSSTDSSATYRSSGVRNHAPQGRDSTSFSEPFPRVPPLKRRASIASSIFSIVIQPTREISQEAQDALVAEDDLPIRIRGIMQCTHASGSYEPTECIRTSSTSSEGAELHPDVALTIDALRSVSNHDLDDIVFS